MLSSIFENTYHQQSSVCRAQDGSLPSSYLATTDQLPRRHGNSPSFADSAKIGISSGRLR